MTKVMMEDWLLLLHWTINVSFTDWILVLQDYKFLPEGKTLTYVSHIELTFTNILKSKLIVQNL